MDSLVIPGIVIIYIIVLRSVYGNEWLISYPVHLLGLYFAMIFGAVNRMFLYGVEWIQTVPPVSPALLVTIWAFPTVYCVAVSFLRKTRGSSRRFPSGLVKGASQSLRLSCFAAILISALLFALYWVQIGSLPIMAAIRGDTDASTSVLREQSTMLFGSGVFRRFWLVFCRYMLPLVTLILYVDYIRRGKKRPSGLLVFALAITVLVLIADTQKAQIAFFIYQMLLARQIFTWVRHSRKTAPASFFKVGMIVYIILVLLYVTTMDVMKVSASLWDRVGYASTAVVRRLTMSQALPLVVVFDDFPDKMPFLLGSTLPTWGILPWTQFDLSEYAFWRLYGAHGGGASTFFLAEAYANFGMGGVAVFAIASPIVLELIHCSMARRSRTVEGIAMYAYLSGYLVRLAITQALMGLGLPVLALIMLQGMKLIIHCAFPYRTIATLSKSFTNSEGNVSV